MRIGVTVRFQNSYFSGSLPQVACAMGKALQEAGHDVSLLHPPNEPDVFLDAGKIQLCKRIAFVPTQHYDVIIEAVWGLTPQDRKTCANHVVLFCPYSPIMYDMESCVYPWNPTVRNFENLSAIWTYDHFAKDDVKYLEFLSGVPVHPIPYVWDADALDVFSKDNNLPSWSESAKAVEQKIPSNAPPMLSWSARIMESNFSNCSHCTIPLCIVSQIRVSGDPIRFTVHNGEATAKHEFFKGNIQRNLLLPDISGNMVPRVRLPDLLREKTFLLAHQRFRPLKSVLLDAMYLGIPMIHNCAKIKTLGAPYFYELNQISGALAAWTQLKTDYTANTGFFSAAASATRRSVLRSTFSPQSLASQYSNILATTCTYVRQLSPAKPLSVPITSPGKLTRISLGSNNKSTANQEIRVAFTELWSEFQPKYNFFMYLLSWYTSLSQVKIVLDQDKPDIVFFGAERSSASNANVESKYPGVPKVFFTGENHRAHPGAFLNLGFDYTQDPNYIRLPLWNLYINWFGANVEKIVNPKPVDLTSCMRVDKAMIEKKKQFCAFVVSNPTNPNRNATFQGLNEWKPVVSAGRLFCNRPEGPLQGGLGGGGGEQIKVDFYKDFQFAITFENETNPGYTTEKLFHAKVAGAIPIYWGDPHVDRDFDSQGFLNMNQATGVTDVIKSVQKLLEDPKTMEAMATIPALSEPKKQAIQRSFMEIAKRIVGKVLPGVTITPPSWDTAQSYGVIYEGGSAPVVQSWIPVAAATTTIAKTEKRIFVTITNNEFVESAVNALISLKSVDKDCEKIVYVWPDVPETSLQALKQSGSTEIRVFPVTEDLPWSDFWNPAHYAFKLWALTQANQAAAPGSLLLYCDAGTAFASSLDTIWKHIQDDDVFLLEDNNHMNERWCHPTFNKHMETTQLELKTHQLWAGCLGFKASGKAADLWSAALTIAKKHPDVIRGGKWQPYSDICLGHRHDQSILSILTSRREYKRHPLKSYYTDHSFRDAKRSGTPLYVHRRQFKDLVPFAEGIDEVFVVNLQRRPDRLDLFKTNHPMLRNNAYVIPAVDGRAIQLTPALCHTFRNNDFKWKKAVMGCALSHLALWEQLAMDSISKTCLILEDDVKLNPDWMSNWARIASLMPDDTDILFLGGVLPPNKPALPVITEPVNAHFARVKQNSLFGGPDRRYFHFCTYSYILTKQGAKKLLAFVKERGIFTSIDHMMVNHGDLFKIYFTTPLLATCTQEEDPVYQKSEFNNFARVDKFDSDLWNNTDCFSEEEVLACLAQTLKNGVITLENPDAQQQTPSHDSIAIWNSFLQQVASQSTNIGPTIETIFTVWKTMDHEAFTKNFAWFRIFDQLIRQQHPVLLLHKQRITELLGSTFTGETAKTVEPLLTFLNGDTANQQIVYYVPGTDISCMLEFQWLEELVGKPLAFRPYTSTSDSNILFFYYFPRSSQEAGPSMVAEFNKLLTKWLLEKKNVTIIHMSDEFGADDCSFYGFDIIKKVFRNYYRPDMGDKVQILPLGYAKDRKNTSSDTKTPTFHERSHLWSFAGSLDRPKRIEALQALRKAGPYVEKTAARWGDPNLTAKEYTDLLRNTKFIPCFAGSKSAESYRIYEALEHGAIPIYVPSDNNIAGCKDEWKECLGENPFLGFPSWEKAAELLPQFLKQSDFMEQHRQQCLTWWKTKKESLRSSLAKAISPSP